MRAKKSHQKNFLNSSKNNKEASEVTSFILDNKISEVECIFPDLTGSARGKVMPAIKYAKEKNFKIPEDIFFNTVTGSFPSNLEDVVDSGSMDMSLIPDVSTICIVPWAQDLTAGIIHDCVRQDGSNVEFAPRNVLKRVLSYYAEHGLEPMIAPEIEFYLTQIDPSPHNPLQPPFNRFKRSENLGSAYSMDSLNDFDPLFETLYLYCDRQNIEIDTLNHEFGTAQLEINFRHGPALKLADNVFRFKRTCREAAINHQMYATFMAKPLEDQPGSSLHIHQSVINKRTGKNIFVDNQGKFSQDFYYFLGGLQKYIPSLMLFFAPNVNSYRRFDPKWTAPTDVEWGIDNRSVGLRVPFSKPENTRIENRISGVDTNPYLSIAASLTAGFLGMTEKIEPRNLVEGNNYPKAYQLPQTLSESLSELDTPNNAHSILDKNFVKSFKIIKACELAEFSKVISSWERKYLLLSV